MLSIVVYVSTVLFLSSQLFLQGKFSAFLDSLASLVVLQEPIQVLYGDFAAHKIRRVEIDIFHRKGQSCLFGFVVIETKRQCP